jgi:hypothetical protein
MHQKKLFLGTQASTKLCADVTHQDGEKNRLNVPLTENRLSPKPAVEPFLASSAGAAPAVLVSILLYIKKRREIEAV